MAERTMMVVTCRGCRAWYNMDYEPALYDTHFNPRTGEACEPDDSDWHIIEVPYRTDWRYAR